MAQTAQPRAGEPRRPPLGDLTRLCRAAAAMGNLVPDAYLAALAIESGAEWITTDREFARYSDLRWRNPLDTGAGTGGAGPG